VADLVTVRRFAWRDRTVRAGTVGCEARLLCPVDSPRHRPQFGLRLEFELTPPSRRARFVAVFVRVRFSDDGVTVARMAADGPGPVSVDALGGQAFGWFFGGFDDSVDLGAKCAVDAVVEAPDDLETVSGNVRVDASIASGRGRRRVEHAIMRSPVAFALRLPARPVAAPPVSAVRLCFAADIERFSRFRAPEAARVQERFAGVLAAARGRAGIDADETALQRLGDGQSAVFPPALDETRAIPLLVEGLADALEQANAGRAGDDRIRIRVALDRGHVAWAANGWVGDSVIAVHRLLDSAPVRQALVDRPDADFALIVSDVVFRDVIAHGYGSLPPREFSPVRVDIPAKSFAESAWVHVPARVSRSSSS
jgi:hypothetical protein